MHERARFALITGATWILERAYDVEARRLWEIGEGLAGVCGPGTSQEVGVSRPVSESLVYAAEA